MEVFPVVKRIEDQYDCWVPRVQFFYSQMYFNPDWITSLVGAEGSSLCIGVQYTELGACIYTRLNCQVLGQGL
jgi:hypothetical protein